MQKLKDYEAMKGVTILLVVLAHVTRMYSLQGVVPIGYSRALEMFTNYIYIFHMPAFVAITGAIYYFMKRERGKYTDQKMFFINKLQRLIVPFFFFSLLVVMPVLFYLDIKDNFLTFFMKEIVLGISSTHLWYSVMIFVVFVFYNRFESQIYNNRESSNWIIFALFNIFSFVIPNAFQATNVLKYLIFFYLGYWFQKNKTKIYPEMRSMLIPSLVGTLVSYFILFHSSVEDMFLMAKLVQLIGGITGTIFIYIASDNLSDSKMVATPLFKRVTESSYGIFLFHPMIVYMLSHWMKGTEANVYFSTLLIFSLALITSLMLVNAMRRFNLQLFIGEKKNENSTEKNKYANRGLNQTVR